MPKKPNARQRILDTAADLFTRKGYSGAGINEIIERSDTAKASFYHHFPSKEDLCVTWLRATHDRSESRHKAILAAPGDAWDKIEGYFGSLKPWLEESGFRGCPYTNTTAGLDAESPRIADQVERHKLSIRDFFIDLARELTDSGAQARRFGSGLFLLYSGATVEAQNLRSTWPVDAALDAARAWFKR